MNGFYWQEGDYMNLGLLEICCSRTRGYAEPNVLPGRGDEENEAQGRQGTPLG